MQQKITFEKGLWTRNEHQVTRGYKVVGLLNMTELVTVAVGQLELGSVVFWDQPWDKLLDEIVHDFDGLSYEVVL